MATSRNKPAAKPAKPTSRATTEVEVVEESPGMGWEAGVAIITAIALVVAILLVDHGMGPLGGGVFF